VCCCAAGSLRDDVQQHVAQQTVAAEMRHSATATWLQLIGSRCFGINAGHLRVLLAICLLKSLRSAAACTDEYELCDAILHAHSDQQQWSSQWSEHQQLCVFMFMGSHCTGGPHCNIN
jgi:hypothetical protein